MNQGDFTVQAIKRAFYLGLKEMYGQEEINSILYMLFEEFEGWTKTRLHLEPRAIVSAEGIKRFSEALSRLELGCPVQYIIGYAHFNELQIKVNPSVLIPRPETAGMAQLLVQKLGTLDLRDFSAMDMGTGSGCIAIYLKKHLPGISMYATDISESALATARSNAISQDTEVEFSMYDMLRDLRSATDRKFNLIVSNPPYVTIKEKQSMMRNVVDYEPHTALFVFDDDPLLYFRAITRYATSRLQGNGLIWLEINEAYGRDVSRLLSSAGFSDVELLQDFHGRDRFVSARLGDV